MAYRWYQPDSKGVYPLFISARPGRLFYAFEAEHYTYRQLPTLMHRSKLCYSCAELVRAGIEHGTLWFLGGCSTD